LWAAAVLELNSVGDPCLGEWRESGATISCSHLRRRLSDRERRLAKNLEEKDIRNTVEYGIRRAAMQRFLPPQYASWQE
jgi:hypothetical protein